jgi:hypothetical protein
MMTRFLILLVLACGAIVLLAGGCFQLDPVRLVQVHSP